MNLIAIQPDLLVNPDRITYIERRVSRGKTTFSVNVEGRTFELTNPPAEFLQQLMKSGVDISKQFFSI